MLRASSEAGPLQERLAIISVLTDPRCTVLLVEPLAVDQRPKGYVNLAAIGGQCIYRGREYIAEHYARTSSSISFSPMTSTPNSRALSSFDPASAPATT